MVERISFMWHINASHGNCIVNNLAILLSILSRTKSSLLSLFIGLLCLNLVSKPTAFFASNRLRAIDKSGLMSMMMMC